MAKTLITCALLYANGPLHLGHLAGVYIPADIYARFCRMRGDQVLFLSGSDEYGLAITLSAQLAGRDPQEHVDHYHQINQELFQRLALSWDHYSRTTWPGHQEPVQRFFLELLKNGHIEERWSDQLYSPQEGRFLSDRYVVGGCPKCAYDQARGDECPRCAATYESTELHHPRSKLTGVSLEKRKTLHWFLKLEEFKEPLLKWLETRSWKPQVMNFVKGYIEELHARAITRDSDWGVPVPLEHAQGKVLYVWFDAPIGYLTAAMEWAQLKGEPELWKTFWLDESTSLVQFLGKDNIPFHAVIFPAMLMGQDLPLKLVDSLPANEFYHFEGSKFSKSQGSKIDLATLLDRYDHEALRYMLAATSPETGDSEFTWEEFGHRVNGELVGKWGNFIHRTLTFIQKRGGTLPSEGLRGEKEKLFLAHLRSKLEEVATSFALFKVRRACQLLMEMAQLANAYFDAQKPWVLLKKGGEEERLEGILSSCVEAIGFLALAACPIFPQKAQRAWALIGRQSELSTLLWEEALHHPLAPVNPLGTPLPAPTPLFEKIEAQELANELA